MKTERCACFFEVTDGFCDFPMTFGWDPENKRLGGDDLSDDKPGFDVSRSLVQSAASFCYGKPLQ